MALSERARIDARKRAENDLYFLVTEILEWGGDKGGPPVEPDFHKALCRWIEDVPVNDNGTVQRTKQLLWPREHGKTTFFSIADNIRWALKIPDICCAIGHAVKDHATPIVEAIRREFESKEKLKWIAPDICYRNPEKESPMWNQDSFVLRRRHHNKTPSFQSVSPESLPTGMHFHIWDWDDLVNERNVQTSAQREKFLNAIRLAVPYVPDRKLGYMKITGTRWHIHDAYGVMIENAKRSGVVTQTEVGERVLSRTFDCLTASMVGPDGEPWLKRTYCVQRTGPNDQRKTLDEKRLEMGSHVYSACMMNKPVADGTAPFNVEDVRRWNSWHESTWTPPVEKRAWRLVTSVDFNIKPNESGDHAVVLTVAKSNRGEMAVVDMDRGHPTQRELVTWIERQCEKWAPLRVYVEAAAYQETFQQLLQERRLLRGSYIPYESVPRGGRQSQTKNTRIMALQALIESRRLWIPEGRAFDPILKEIEEFSQEGKDQMDDCLDCLADAYRLGGWAPGVEQKESVQTERQAPFGGILASKLLDIWDRRMESVVVCDETGAVSL